MSCLTDGAVPECILRIRENSPGRIPVQREAARDVTRPKVIGGEPFETNPRQPMEDLAKAQRSKQDLPWAGLGSLKKARPPEVALKCKREVAHARLLAALECAQGCSHEF